MDLSQIPLFAVLKGKLQHTSERQKLIAANVANADVPGFAPKDLKPFALNAGQQRSLRAPELLPVTLTSPAHMEVASTMSPAAGVEPVAAPDSEVRLDGNHVVLEEQMVKMSEARMDYDAAIGFYQQSMAMLKTALTKPGG